MVCNLIYRNYGDFFVAYSPTSNNYLLIEDIFADFFRMEYDEKLSVDEVENAVVEEYGVDKEVVHNDLLRFHNEIENATNIESPISVYDDLTLNRSIMQQQIFDKMSEMVIPFSATIEVVDSCNLNCVHCYRGTAQASYWTESSFFNTLTELKSLGTMNITITGGEPFTHPLINSFLEMTKQLGFVVSVQSNLILLNDSIISALKKNAVNCVSVSLYSTNEHEHDAITQTIGSMKKTIANIRELIKNGIPTSLNCPIMTINKNAMADMCKFAKELGVDVNFSLKIIPSQDANKSIENLNVFSKEFILSSMCNPEIQLYKKELANIRSTKRRNRYCQTGFRSITFDAQGNMLICNAYRKNCGSLINMSVNKLWHDSPPLNRWRKETSLVIEKCQKCPAYSYCEPCPAHSFTVSGDEENIDELTCRFGSNFYAADIEYLNKGGENNEKRI